MSTEVVIPEVMGKEEVVRSRYRNVQEAGEWFRKQCSTIGAQNVMLFWDLGKEVAAIKSGVSYKASTAELATMIGVDQIDVKHLNRCHQFFQRVPEAKMRKAIAPNKIGWGHVNRLLSIKDEEEFNKLLDLASRGEITTTEIDAKRQESNNETSEKKAAVEKDPVDLIIGTLKKMDNAFAAVLKQIPEVEKAIDNSSMHLKEGSAKEAEYHAMIEGLKTTAENFPENIQGLINLLRRS